MSDFSMKGVGGAVCVTMPLDATTKAAIGKEYDKAVGKAVALTSNNTVGYGTAGDALFGVIAKVEHDGFASVQVKGFACGLAGTASSTAINKFAAVDGAGGVKSAGSGVVSNGYITAFDSTSKSTDIFM